MNQENNCTKDCHKYTKDCHNCDRSTLGNVCPLSKTDVDSADPYFELNLVLQNAMKQASQGKGKERHANDNNYEDQVICIVGRLLKDHPFGAHAYQVIKKTIEAGRLYKISRPEAAYNEMLGAINYAAAMNILIKEKD
jgi:GrpB-like predicted nucleotidyltransferase (UPF0157 family)